MYQMGSKRCAGWKTKGCITKVMHTMLKGLFKRSQFGTDINVMSVDWQKWPCGMKKSTHPIREQLIKKICSVKFLNSCWEIQHSDQKKQICLDSGEQNFSGRLPKMFQNIYLKMFWKCSYKFPKKLLITVEGVYSRIDMMKFSIIEEETKVKKHLSENLHRL